MAPKKKGAKATAASKADKKVAACKSRSRSRGKDAKAAEPINEDDEKKTAEPAKEEEKQDEAAEPAKEELEKKEELAEPVKKEETEEDRPKEEPREEAKEQEEEEETAAKGPAKEPAKEVERQEGAGVERQPTGPKGLVEEADAVSDDRPKVEAGSVSFNMAEATPNAMSSQDGRIIMALCDGGLQYLFAGVKCNTGVKSGRYMFEVKLSEMLNPSEGASRDRMRSPQPRHQMRIGFSLAGSSALLDEQADKVFFDSDGFFCHQGQRVKSTRWLLRDAIISTLLNLDADAPNGNTLSLFKDGQRLCDPQPLPENLLGQTLFPMISFKNITLQVNFGPTPKKPLPFKCRMLQDAAAADVEVAPPAAAGKPEVLIPIGLPDQGLFDYMDQFLEENPKYLELSDRKVLDWAKKCGLQPGSSRRSADRPGMSFGLPCLDDSSVQKTIAAVAPLLRRNICIMELRSNLLRPQRKAILALYPVSEFKRIALVAMGEPPSEFISRTHQLLLERKKKDAERARDQRKVDGHRGNVKRVREEKADEPEKTECGEGGDEEKDAEMKDGEEAADGAEKKEEAEAVEADVELTDEEKKLFYVRHEYPDLTDDALAKSFASFSLPDDSEGFDEIRYVWQKAPQSAAHLKEWMLQLKKTLRAEDLEPSAWFKEKWSEWQRLLHDWRKKQTEAKDALKRKKSAPQQKVEKKADEAKKDKADEEKEDVKEGKDGDEQAGKDEENGKERKQEEPPEKDVNEKDKDEDVPKDTPADAAEEEPEVDDVEDINDIGCGKPLFVDFSYEDWTLLALRYEFHLLVHSFRHDLADPDRPGFQEAHLGFYYQKYFNKVLNLKNYNVATLAEFVDLIETSIKIDPETSFLSAPLAIETPPDKFVRLTEQHRRDRQQSIDAGDETANLKFTRPTPPPPKDSYRGGGGGLGGGGGGGVGSRGGGPPSYGGGGGGKSRGSYSGSGGKPGGGQQGGDTRGYGKGGGGGSGGGGGPRGSYSHQAPHSQGRHSQGPSRGGGSYGEQHGGSQKRPYTPPPPPLPYGSSKQGRYGSGPPQRGGYATQLPPQSSGYGGGGSSSRGGYGSRGYGGR